MSMVQKTLNINLFPLQSHFITIIFQKNTMKKIIIILLILISNNLSAQDVLTESFRSENLETLNDAFSKKDLIKINDNKAQITWGNPRLNNRLGLNIIMGGPSTVLSLSFDFFITSSVNIEAGAGFWGLFSGMKYHFLGSKNTAKWTPYLGLFYAYNITYDDEYTNIYIPLGLQYTGNKGFRFAVELAGILGKDIDYSYAIPIWGAIKFGFHPKRRHSFWWK